ncbi:MAG: prealbumin-like fold domain-containing protein [Clostridiales bacterium]|jgi:uncharacterized surface anchored protein|nr:prealbumin-like fold domain-containing protein [Clostridiales bacterium]
MRNSRLEGVKFGLFNHAGRQIATGCTNRNGEIDFEGLPMGRYVLQQLSRHGDFDGERVCKEVVIDCNGRCRTVEFENVMQLGGIRVQLSARTERCDFGPRRHNCNCGCNSLASSSCDEDLQDGECGSSSRW